MPSTPSRNISKLPCFLLNRMHHRHVGVVLQNIKASVTRKNRNSCKQRQRSARRCGPSRLGALQRRELFVALLHCALEVQALVLELAVFRLELRAGKGAGHRDGGDELLEGAAGQLPYLHSAELEPGY